MTDSYQQILKQAQAAINAGEKQAAIDLLREAVQQKPADPRPWLAMVYAAPTKKLALEYLKEAKQRKANPFSYAQAKRWVENFSEVQIVEATPPQKTGIIIKIFEMLERSPAVVALIYVIMLALAELLTTQEDPRWGLMLHGISLIVLLGHASVVSHSENRYFLISLSLAPLIRLLSLTIPLSPLPQIYWYAIVGLPLFIATFALIKITGLPRKRIGLGAGKFPVQLLISLSGIALGYVEYLILQPAPLVTEFSFKSIILPALILLIFTGFLEELIFRGVFQFFSIRYLGRWGIFYVALIFAIFHLGYQSFIDFLFVFVVSILFSYFVRKTGSIAGVTLAHGLTNIGLYLIFPFVLASSGTSINAASTPLPDQTNQVFSPTAELLNEIAYSPIISTPISTNTKESTPILPAEIIEPEINTLEPCPTEDGTIIPGFTPGLDTIVDEGYTTFIVDDGEDNFSRTGGNWWRTVKGVYEDLVWAYAITEQPPSAAVEWKMKLEVCGFYKVSVYIPCDYGTAAGVSYKLSYLEEDHTAIIDQSASQGEWVQIGEFWIDPGSLFTVQVNNVIKGDSSRQMVAFDAVRWELIEPCD